MSLSTENDTARSERRGARGDNAPGSEAGSRRHTAGAAVKASGGTRPWYRTTFALAMAGGLLLYAAFPPLNLWPLAWVATAPWLLLVRAERLPGRRPYRWIYAAALVHWLLLVQWVRLGHWAAHFGWLALSLYLAAYLPVFVWLARIAVHRLRLPLVVAAPAVWVGLECLRGWALTGFAFAMLGHTQVGWLPLIQISDLAGAYAVSFVVMLVTASLVEMMPRSWVGGCSGNDDDEKDRPQPNPLPRGEEAAVRWWPAIIAALLMAATLGYGYYRLAETPPGERSERAANIALVQGSIDTVFGDATLDERTLKQYYELTGEALRQRPDAIIWPESTLPFYNAEVDASGDIQSGRWLPTDQRKLDGLIRRMQRDFRGWAFALGKLPEGRHVPLILGGTTLRLGPHRPQRLNSALLIDERGQLADVYHKMHPVMFGEYAPGGRLIPWVYELMPIPDGLTAGERPVVFRVNSLSLTPSICYENSVPHLIRRQVATLRREGREPDVLLTLSNDGWFRGSSELDLHLICGQFRAVELRKPALIAANTGFSAHIDGNGRLLARGPRRDTEVLVRSVRPDGRESLYAKIGDVPANACLLLCAGLVVFGIFRRERAEK